MTSIQNTIEACLFSSDIGAKLDAIKDLDDLLSLGETMPDFTGLARPTSDVEFPDKPQWVMPRKLKRRSMTDPEGLKVFLHAVAHIEFVAIHLALDAAYRAASQALHDGVERFLAGGPAPTHEERARYRYPELRITYAPEGQIGRAHV